MALIDFIGLKISQDDLKTTMRVLREFKRQESNDEYWGTMFDMWVKLEQFEDYLRILLGIELEDVNDPHALDYYVQKFKIKDDNNPVLKRLIDLGNEEEKKLRRSK